jgi:hypothetical protein
MEPVMYHIEYACTIRSPELTHALEFGVAGGNSIRRMRASLPPDIEIHGFDSFAGLPEDWRDARGALIGVCSRGFFSTCGVVPDIPGVTFHEGLFTATIPVYRRNAYPISVLHIDCDLYSSTATVLRGLSDVIVPDTLIVFDEWCYDHDPRNDDHEQRAFREWAYWCDRTYELVSFTSDAPYADERQIVRITR